MHTLMGCTTITDWKKDKRNVVSHSLAFSLPHSMLYKMVKNAGAITLKKHTETNRIKCIVHKEKGKMDGMKY